MKVRRSFMFAAIIVIACFPVGVFPCVRDSAGTIVPTPVDGGIREDIPDDFRARFDRWKAELLSTEFGRRQWEEYASRKDFVLTIKVAASRGKGAETGKFLWNEDGKFVGATIILGVRIDDGYPDPVYYPVLNSLSADATNYSISGKILAATKLSHEIGHVNQTALANMKQLDLQSKLTLVYNSILLKNGRDANDRKLIDLAQQMGGTPIEIWETREYRSEVNAMLFLSERIDRESFNCFVFNKIRANLRNYARSYETLFGRQSEYSTSRCWN